MLRLFADENVHVDIIASLRNEGFDVITVIEVGLVAHKDYQILEYAEKEERILITGDKDFGGLLEFGYLYRRGKVILLRYTTMNIQRITSELIKVLEKEKETFAKEETLLVVLSEGRYRMHHPEI
jgi:predicted nuclease of predicted toxin-antitoxin system